MPMKFLSAGLEQRGVESCCRLPALQYPREHRPLLSTARPDRTPPCALVLRLLAASSEEKRGGWTGALTTALLPCAPLICPMRSCTTTWFDRHRLVGNGYPFIMPRVGREGLVPQVASGRSRTEIFFLAFESERGDPEPLGTRSCLYLDAGVAAKRRGLYLVMELSTATGDAYCRRLNASLRQRAPAAVQPESWPGRVLSITPRTSHSSRLKPSNVLVTARETGQDTGFGIREDRRSPPTARSTGHGPTLNQNTVYDPWLRHPEQLQKRLSGVRRYLCSGPFAIAMVAHPAILLGQNCRQGASAPRCQWANARRQPPRGANHARPIR